ncbi:hypothetical protein E7Z59_13090 [Robertkochia marina]|uniref:Uncharacterized protein n=1 Tax=Robertkochia marina TaxID=1227945 RepID=A0A4S3M175_9FLAO|nr:hypothetical protein [Robertkochia marina]THD66713.1 hypothetical protein E7Z59_13090 [Robertkochia marina]TRZ42398.1 hypothetical protein D3A96_12115 [Robertkochia marina]
MAIADNWEEEIIENILDITKHFITKHNLSVFEIVKETRDDGYIKLVNSKGYIVITIHYLPNYDVVVESYPYNISAYVKLIKAMISNSDYDNDRISLKEVLNNGQPINHLEFFLDNCMNHIEKNYNLQ